MSGFRRAYSIAGVVLLVLLALQFYLIATAALHVWGSDNGTGARETQNVFDGFKAGDSFASLHAINGDLVIPVVILVMIGLAFGARHTARVKWLTAALFGLMALQFVLASLSFVSGALAPLAGLHGVNALAIVGLTVYLVRENWALARAPRVQPSAAAAPSPTSEMGASGQ